MTRSYENLAYYEMDMSECGVEVWPRQEPQRLVACHAGLEAQRHGLYMAPRRVTSAPGVMAPDLGPNDAI